MKERGESKTLLITFRNRDIHKAYTVWLNTLPEDARQYVVLNKNGYIDPYILQQYIGEDLNYSDLIELVFSEMVVT